MVALGEARGAPNPDVRFHLLRGGFSGPKSRVPLTAGLSVTKKGLSLAPALGYARSGGDGRFRPGLLQDPASWLTRDARLTSPLPDPSLPQTGGGWRKREIAGLPASK